MLEGGGGGGGEEGGREGGRKGQTDGGMEGGREGGREGQHNFSSCSASLSEKKQLSSVWTREQEEELEELFQRYRHEDGEG